MYNRLSNNGHLPPSMRQTKCLLFVLAIFIFGSRSTHAQNALFEQTGMQPSLATGPDGALHLVFGTGNAIYYAYSADDGANFSVPELVDSLTGLHLGASRAPRIAASRRSVVITAIDRKGDLYAYSRGPAGRWAERQRVNDVPEIAKEGFNALTGDGEGNFFVTWLDLRQDKKNKLYGATSSDDGKSWSANRLVYRSPDSTVCECCQPSALMRGKEVFVMFRNWIDGSRDMYLLASNDKGKTFRSPVKLGQGTWKLNACPMDGGDISASAGKGITTVWRRQNQLYLARPGSEEQPIAQGRNASIAVSGPTTYVAWQHEGNIWFDQVGRGKPEPLGAGRFPRLVALSGNRTFCVWEEGGVLRGQVLAVGH